MIREAAWYFETKEDTKKTDDEASQQSKQINTNTEKKNWKPK